MRARVPRDMDGGHTLVCQIGPRGGEVVSGVQDPPGGLYSQSEGQNGSRDCTNGITRAYCDTMSLPVLPFKYANESSIEHSQRHHTSGHVTISSLQWLTASHPSHQP
jgi:hypothetical protein